MWLSLAAKYVTLSWRIFRANLKSASSFRLSFLLHIIGATIFFGGQFFIWTIFFKQFPMVGGWTTHNLIVVYSLFVWSISIIEVFLGGIMDLAKIINAGNLDYFLTMPKPILWHAAVSRSDVVSLGPIGLSLFFFVSSAPFDPIRLLLFLLASFFSVLLLFNFIVITQSIAFFIGGFDRGASAVRHLLAIISPYPFTIFPSPFKYVLMTVIPSFFVITLPAQLITHFSAQTFFILVGVALLSSLLTYKIFNAGLHRYESGNLMSTRI